MRIALLVDNPYRDLPGLVLIAMYLCQRGATCYLVPKNLAYSEIWPLVPDFVLLHHLRTVNQEFVRELLQSSIEVGVLDTEGGVLTSLDSYAKLMAPDPSIRHGIGCFCSWGAKLANYAIDKAWYLADQVMITGAPRFDFYVPPWSKAALEVSRYADSFPRPIILVNGNFPTVNPEFQTPEEEAQMLVERFGYGRDEVLNWQKIQRQTMLEMVQLANRLAARFPQATFIYRPHPFERMDTYKSLLDSRNNLHLTRQGTVDGWILRASAVIQRSCSTAIEAGMAGVPALMPAWIPTAFVMEAAERVSIPCQTVEELIDRLDEALNGTLEVPTSINHALDGVIADWFHKNDGEAHRRVGDCIMATIKKSRRQVRLEWCRDKVYGLDSPNMPLKTRAIIQLKARLGIPANWLILHRRYITGDFAWDNSQKYFNAAQVKSMIDAIAASAPAESEEPLRQIRVQASRERGDYRFAYRQGRSVTLFPQ